MTHNFAKSGTLLKQLGVNVRDLPDDYLWAMYESLLYRRYKGQQTNAKSRGIAFELTFEEWLTIWVKSGKLDFRGKRKNSYVMSRKGDVGPYSADNAVIITATENSHDGNWRHKKSNGAALRKHYQLNPMTEEHRVKIRNALRGRTFSPESRLKMSIAAKLRCR